MLEIAKQDMQSQMEGGIRELVEKEYLALCSLERHRGDTEGSPPESPSSERHPAVSTWDSASGRLAWLGAAQADSWDRVPTALGTPSQGLVPEESQCGFHNHFQCLLPTSMNRCAIKKKRQRSPILNIVKWRLFNGKGQANELNLKSETEPTQEMCWCLEIIQGGLHLMVSILF